MKLPKSVVRDTERGDARRVVAKVVPTGETAQRDAEVVDYADRLGPAADRRFREKP